MVKMKQLRWLVGGGVWSSPVNAFLRSCSDYTTVRINLNCTGMYNVYRTCLEGLQLGVEVAEDCAEDATEDDADDDGDNSQQVR